MTLTQVWLGSLLGVVVTWCTGPLGAFLLLTGAYLLKVVFGPEPGS